MIPVILSIDSSGKLQDMALVQYSFADVEHSVSIAKHGHSKERKCSLSQDISKYTECAEERISR